MLLINQKKRKCKNHKSKEIIRLLIIRKTKIVKIISKKVKKRKKKKKKSKN